MIPPYPNDGVALRELPDKVQDPLVRWLQFRIRVVDNVAIQDKFMILGNACEKTLEVLIEKVPGPYVQIADNDCVHFMQEWWIQPMKESLTFNIPSTKDVYYALNDLEFQEPIEDKIGRKNI